MEAGGDLTSMLHNKQAKALFVAQNTAMASTLAKAAGSQSTMVDHNMAAAEFAHFPAFKASRVAGVPQGESSNILQVSFSEASQDDTEIFFDNFSKGQEHQDKGRYCQALSCYRRALKMKSKIIRNEPSNVQEAFADILFHVGTIHQLPQTIDNERSLEAFHYCLDIRKLCYGSCHPKVGSVLFKLASLHFMCGEFYYSLSLLLEILSVLIHEEHRNELIEVWTAIGKVQRALGDEDEAQSAFFEADQLRMTTGSSS